MDLSGLTDCQSFIEGGPCPSGKCPFRHSDAARKTIFFCASWFAKQCTDVLCPKRHPKLPLRQSDSQSKERNARCLSHNTFKCTGQCGFDECNTHFGDQEPLQEHINRGRKKMISRRSSCSQCNALFFSEQEREEHVCLSAITEPSSSCQANVPPQNLIRPQYLYGNPSTSLSPSGQGLLNNTDSLAFENPQPGTPSQAPTVPEAEPIGVFWDIENCQVPRNKSASEVVQKIRDCYFTGKREVKFMCVCNARKEKEEITEELNKAQVDVVHINATAKNPADNKLKQSLRRFAKEFSSPATVILISGDIDFAAELSDLRYQHNFYVICLHNTQAQHALLQFAHEARRFDHFTADLPDRKAPKKNGQSSELLVHNLPMGKPDASVRNELKELSANCKGKVVSISGCTAVLRFPNPASATRARGRMDKEDVLGSKIQVVYSRGSHKTQPMSPKSTPSTLQKGKKDSSCALLDTSGIESTIPSRHTTKRESNPSQTPTDESPNSGDSSANSIKSRETCMFQKSTPSTLQKGKEDSSCALLDTFGNESTIPSRHTTKKEGNPSQTHTDESTDSGNSREENVTNDDLAASGLASLQNCTVLDKQEEGCDLLVTNLDENVSKKELEKELASVFQEHCEVLSVSLHGGESTHVPLSAFVKVPRQSDANLAIEKVHQREIFNSRVTVNMATKKVKQHRHLMLEVVSILEEVPLYFLPLDKFLSDYHKKFSKMFEMNSLICLQDWVVLTGKPGNQAISLVTKAIGGVRVSVDPDQFANDVHTLLKSCGGSLPLVSFAASYLLEFDRKIESNVQGSALKEVLRFVPNVKVTESLTVSWAQQALEHGGNVSKLLEFTKDLRELLQEQKEFKLPFSSLISKYQVWFEKKTQLVPADYGFASVINLLKALPAVVEVTQQGKETWIILSQRLKMKAFANNVRMLLETQADGVIAMGKFVSSYSKYFSQDCKMATFGFSKLRDLIEAVPNVAKIQGTGNEQLICLVGKDKSSKPEKRSDKETLVKELEKFLSRCDSQRFPVARLHTRYWIDFDRPLKFEDYGAQHLEDFLESSPSLQIIEISGKKYLTYSPKVTVQSLQGHLVELLKRQDEKFLPISRVAFLLRKQRDMEFLLEQGQLEKLLPRLKAVEVRGSGNDRILLLPPLPAEDNMSPELQPLANEVTNLLLKFPGCRVAESSFADNFRQEYGKMLKPEDWGFTTMASLVQALGDVLEVQDSGNDAKVCLRYEQYLKEFSRHVIHVLTEKSDKTIPLSQFVTAYEKLCNHKLRVQNFGFASLEDMFRAISPVVKVDTKGDKLSLTLLQTFAIETRNLLKHLNGCVSLNHFSQNFNQFYGRTFKTSDYGFRGISELIDAVSNVAEIRGSGKEKMVILVDGDNASVLGSGNMRIPNGEASGTILGHTVTDNWLMASASETFPDSELTSPISEPKRIGKLMSCFPM